ncbi:class I mannose-6-phosphate isomerase [Pedobacter faecalis]|uniref:class I mannose-6-phosphate isomerase n=1 Tax=Pedobacter faecalis TaxID=3041495 RepID=UPI002549FE3F|nr:class I mannose-6-phosphate isomerase [Pedobacter sp. ELA7]
MYDIAQAESNNPASADKEVDRKPTLPQNISNRSDIAAYDIFPFHQLGSGKIHSGYDGLAAWMSGYDAVVIDGFNGVFWAVVQHELDNAFERIGKRVNWVLAADFMRAAGEIDRMVQPFLGSGDSVWGTKSTLQIQDFFDMDAFKAVRPAEGYDLNIVVGTGATLAGWEAPVVYIDLPKNVLQYRMRAGKATNFGAARAEESGHMYKRAYFVDWVVLNAYKQQLLSKIAVMADTQWDQSVNWLLYPDLADGLTKLSRSVFRVRPWFEPGAWGGHWMQERIEGLDKSEVNYAWSFEMIVPENGIVFESDGNLLEVSFDCLMFHDHKAVLGKHADVFKTEFPIRFDFLDTWDGGNLSIQCHPSKNYIRETFGENFTQDETYYILDAKEDAGVYLGFTEDIKPEQFREKLEYSLAHNEEIDVLNYVQLHPAKKHDFFLIPNGTVHSAAANNLVLEISATPYIFTFKVYDWVRLDLSGMPRPINIDHAFKNLDFSRKGNKVQDELISKPQVIDEGGDWQLVHLPTHAEHFYDVHRLEFDSTMVVETNGLCHILMLVEGTSLTITTADGTTSRFHYAETFAVPAAALSYTLHNEGGQRAKVVKAFVKPDFSQL